MTHGSHSTDLAISGANTYERVRIPMNAYEQLRTPGRSRTPKVGCGRHRAACCTPLTLQKSVRKTGRFRTIWGGGQNWTIPPQQLTMAKIARRTNFFLAPPGLFSRLTCLTPNPIQSRLISPNDMKSSLSFIHASRIGPSPPRTRTNVHEHHTTLRRHVCFGFSRSFC
jgi:hypothetical protein